MTNTNEISEKENPPILSVIQEIKDGRMQAENLSKEIRQQCVEVFTMEGYTVSQMAQILKKCDKTIRRDISEIRECNTLSPSIEFAKKLVGEMVTYSRAHRSHLMRMARGQNTSTSEKAQAEYFAHRVMMDTISKLQTLGYLPLKPQEIVADFSHHISSDDEKSLGELKAQIIEIERVAKKQGELAPETARELEGLKRRIEKADIQHKVIGISTQNKEGSKNEQDD